MNVWILLMLFASGLLAGFCFGWQFGYRSGRYDDRGDTVTYSLSATHKYRVNGNTWGRVEEVEDKED